MSWANVIFIARTKNYKFCYKQHFLYSVVRPEANLYSIWSPYFNNRHRFHPSKSVMRLQFIRWEVKMFRFRCRALLLMPFRIAWLYTFDTINVLCSLWRKCFRFTLTIFYVLNIELASAPASSIPKFISKSCWFNRSHLYIHASKTPNIPSLSNKPFGYT